jgi:hypothetical protein
MPSHFEIFDVTICHLTNSAISGPSTQISPSKLLSLQRGLGLIERQPELRHHCLCPRQCRGRVPATEVGGILVPESRGILVPESRC